MEEQPPAEEQPQEPAEPEPAKGEHVLYVCVLIVRHDLFVDGKSVLNGHFHGPSITKIIIVHFISSIIAPERPPRTKYFSLQPDDPVELLIGESGITAEEPISVGAFFKEAVRNYPDTTALGYKGEDGEWVKLTYTQYYDMCVRAAKSFLKVL